jgi:hypothetical protein
MAPRRFRRPKHFLAAALLLAALVAAAAIVLTASTGGPKRVTPPARAASPLRSVHLTAAHDYDPFGTDMTEHAADASKAVDGDGSTSWTTESYQTGELGKKGVGLYVDAGSSAPARRLDIRTSTPGYLARIYGSNAGEPSHAGSSTFRDWGEPLASVAVTSPKKVYLDTGGRSYRYYLIWVVRLPRGNDHAEIATVRLYK